MHRVTFTLFSGDTIDAEAFPPPGLVGPARNAWRPTVHDFRETLASTYFLAPSYRWVQIVDGETGDVLPDGGELVVGESDEDRLLHAVLKTVPDVDKLLMQIVQLWNGHTDDSGDHAAAPVAVGAGAEVRPVGAGEAGDVDGKVGTNGGDDSSDGGDVESNGGGRDSDEVDQEGSGSAAEELRFPARYYVPRRRSEWNSPVFRKKVTNVMVLLLDSADRMGFKAREIYVRLLEIQKLPVFERADEFKSEVFYHTGCSLGSEWHDSLQIVIDMNLKHSRWAKADDAEAIEALLEYEMSFAHD